MRLWHHYFTPGKYRPGYPVKPVVFWSITDSDRRIGQPFPTDLHGRSRRPDQRAAAYVKLVSDLQTIGLEVNGIDAAGRVVFVPKGICAKPTKPSTISEAAQLLKNRDYTLASCSEPPIVISSACRTKSD